MTDDSYHMPICIGIGIGISISKIFSSVLGMESIGKSGIGPPLVICVLILYCLLCSGGPVDNFDTASHTTSDCGCRRYAYVIKYNARILYHCITTKIRFNG